MNIDEKLTEIDQRLSEIDSELSRLSSLKRKLIQAKDKLKDEKYLKKQNELENNDWSQGKRSVRVVLKKLLTIQSFRNVPVVEKHQGKAEKYFQPRNFSESAAGDD
jgi:hypothetical protein